MSNALEALKPNVWYKGLIVVSALIVLGAIAARTPNVGLMAAGFLAIGFGEWINHPPVTTITRAYRYTASERDAGVLGIAVEIGGALIVCFAAYRLCELGM